MRKEEDRGGSCDGQPSGTSWESSNEGGGCGRVGEKIRTSCNLRFFPVDSPLASPSKLPSHDDIGDRLLTSIEGAKVFLGRLLRLSDLRRRKPNGNAFKPTPLPDILSSLDRPQHRVIRERDAQAPSLETGWYLLSVRFCCMIHISLTLPVFKFRQGGVRSCKVENRPYIDHQSGVLHPLDYLARNKTAQQVHSSLRLTLSCCFRGRQRGRKILFCIYIVQPLCI